MTPGTTGVVALAIGATFGLGVWMLVAAIPRLSRPRLAERIAPTLVDVSPEARLVLEARRQDASRVLAAFLEPAAASARRWLGRLLGGDESLARRLRQAGGRRTVEAFRLEQAAWGCGGLLAGAAVAVAAPWPASIPLLVRGLVPVLAAAVAALGREQLLLWAARRRLARISAELPTVLEFLALSLTAGEGLGEAVRRVARAGDGELPREFAALSARVGTGVPLATALAGLRDELDHPALGRAIDQLLGALERGAPLASVLRAQAADTRAEAKRELLEAAGRKEVAMLVPLVFLILPITVCFALYPGFMVLQAGF